jgi:serine phosphatase RsbU (regulator of sigma subunit)
MNWPGTQELFLLLAAVVCGVGLCLAPVLALYAHHSGQRQVHALALCSIFAGLTAFSAFASEGAAWISILSAGLTAAAFALSTYLEMRFAGRGTGLPRILVLCGAVFAAGWGILSFPLHNPLPPTGAALFAATLLAGAGLLLLQKKRARIEKPSLPARAGYLALLCAAAALAFHGTGLIAATAALAAFSALSLLAVAAAAHAAFAGSTAKEGAVATNRTLRLAARNLEDENRQLTDMAARLEFEKGRLQQKRGELEKENRQAEDRIRDLCRTADSFYTLGQSIDYARRIQQALTPSDSKLRSLLGESFVLNLPRDKVSGDFVWCENLGEGWVLLFLADCTGHGVPGAFMSALGTMMLGQIAVGRSIRRPDQVLAEMDAGLRNALSSNGGSVQDGMEAAALLLAPGKRQALYCGAKLPLFRAANGACEVVEGVRRSIGGRLRDNSPSFEAVNLTLRRGEMLYLSSDGFQDQLGGPEDHRYMKARFRDTLAWTSALPVAEQRATLLSSHNQWRGKRDQTDDVMVAGLRIDQA